MDAIRFCGSLHQSNFRPFLSYAKAVNLNFKMVTASLHNSKTSDGCDLPNNNAHVPLDSILNLRRIDAHGKLYRSAKQDKASPEDIKHLQSLGIRTHLDLRSKTEYLRKRTPKAIDCIVGVLVPKSFPDPKVKPYPAISDIPMKGLKKKSVDEKDLSTMIQRRYLIDFFSFELALKTFNSGSLFKRLISLFVLLFDVIVGNNFKNFVRMFKDTINDHGLSGQYIDMLEFGGKQLCFSKLSIGYNSIRAVPILILAHLVFFQSNQCNRIEAGRENSLAPFLEIENSNYQCRWVYRQSDKDGCSVW